MPHHRHVSGIEFHPEVAARMKTHCRSCGRLIPEALRTHRREYCSYTCRLKAKRVRERNRIAEEKRVQYELTTGTVHPAARAETSTAALADLEEPEEAPTPELHDPWAGVAQE